MTNNPEDEIHSENESQSENDSMYSKIEKQLELCNIIENYIEYLSYINIIKEFKLFKSYLLYVEYLYLNDYKEEDYIFENNNVILIKNLAIESINIIKEKINNNITSDNSKDDNIRKIVLYLCNELVF